MTGRLQSFIAAVRHITDGSIEETRLLDSVQDAMRTLVAADDWLPTALAVPHPQHYQQYLLHSDPCSRFSIVSFVWGPGQQTPIHDHTVWGVIGMLRGAELSQAYRLCAEGLAPQGGPQRLEPGQVTTVSPRIGDIHRVANAFADRVSISIHAYGADIGRTRRRVFNPLTGTAREFISGYANAAIHCRD